ncbi:MAG: 16S rRNA (guanine(527)-N(7))-methyltransferase RsmG [Bryobacteraceae bacterium]
MSEFGRELCSAFACIGELDLGVVARLEQHYTLLLRWNRVLNLTRVTVLREAVRRHYCESLLLAKWLPDSTRSVLDVGSGAGFPGVVVAAYRPGVRVVLAERRRRKAAFLKEATRGWANVEVWWGPAQEAVGEFEWVVSRAVDPVEVVKIARRKARGVALLVSADAVGVLQGLERIQWGEVVMLPWGERRALVLGRLST